MFQAIVRFAVTKKLFVGLTTLFLLAGGIYAMLTLPVDAVPDITNNQVQIVTVSPTLAPQEVEQLITFPIEVAMSNIMNVEEIRSVSRFGLSVVTVVFKESVPILDARQLINEQIQTVAGEIPTELGMPEMMPITTGLGEIYQYTLDVAPGYEDKYDAMELRTIQDWIVKRQLSGIPGIVEINSFGGYLKQYEVAVDPDALYSLNITISDVFDALSRNNQNTGGSYIEKVNRAYYIRSEGMISSLDDIRQIVVTNRGGIPIHISDVGTVKFGSAKRFGAMTRDGKGECVGGIAMMLKGANANVVTKELEARVEKIQKMLPEGVTISPYLNRSELVSRNISTVIRNLIEGAIIVFVVLIVFLGNARAGLIVASVIPLAMLFAFILMRIFGVSANLMSLGAIDFGIVVDGSIVIVEGILAHLFSQSNLGRTLSRKQMDAQVIAGAGNVVRSATFAVIIILIVFFPILTLTGIEGKYFTPMAKTLVFCIIGALLLSLTYVPMMSSLLPGAYVKKGSVLATLENPDFIALQQSYLDSHAQNEYLRTEFERQQTLSREEASSQKRYQQSKAEYLSMRSRMDTAAAQLALLGIDTTQLLANGIVPYLEVKSPISGYAANVNMNIGRHFDVGEPLCEIVDKSNMMLRLTAYEKDLHNLKAGDSVIFRVNGIEGKTFRGAITMIGQQVNNENRSIDVYVRISEQNPQFRPGMYATARVELK